MAENREVIKNSTGKPEEAGQSGKRSTKVLAVVIAAVLAACAFGLYRWYWWNLPSQQQERLLEEAAGLMEAGEYAKAREVYSQVTALGEAEKGSAEAAARAAEGELRAMGLMADALAAEPDLSARAQALSLYEEILRSPAPGSASSGGEDSLTEAAPAGTAEETAVKLARLREEVASAFDAVACTTAREDRSGTAVLPDGQSVPYLWYYDLVQVTEEYYPYADRINEVLAQDRNAFFAGGTDPAGSIQAAQAMEPLSDAAGAFSTDSASVSAAAGASAEEASAAGSSASTAAQAAAGAPVDEASAAGSSAATAAQAAVPRMAPGNYRDYVGEAGVYSGDGILSIRMAQVRVHGASETRYFRGRTFRLSDGAEMTLAELTGRTDTGLKRLVRRRIATYLEEEGYRDIAKSEIEKYVEETEADAFKFCVREDLGPCLVIDQDVPFFRAADAILEIPLVTE